MKKFRITYKELNEEHYPLESRLTMVLLPFGLMAATKVLHLIWPSMLI